MPSKSPRKILIVDPATGNGGHLRDLVRQAGWVPVCAAGEDAIERAKAERPAVVLMDLVLPPVDGYEVCRQFRADQATRHIPVIVVSGRAQKADQLWARMQGASDLVSKPCDVDGLLGAIRIALF